jgi:hypothetical protein
LQIFQLARSCHKDSVSQSQTDLPRKSADLQGLPKNFACDT